jgi:hypothetical protein
VPSAPGLIPCLCAVAAATGLALPIAPPGAGVARASTQPRPDPSTQIQPDAAPVSGQPQAPSRSGSGPQTAGEVTPAAPTPVAPRRTPALPVLSGASASRSAAAGSSATRDQRSRARQAAAHGAARHRQQAGEAGSVSRRPSPLFAGPLSPSWKFVQLGSSRHGGGAAPPLAALVLLLLVVAGASLLRLSGEAARGRPV